MTGARESDDVAGVRQAEARFYDALLQLMNGDSGPLKEVLSRREDATMFLGWGGHERGWVEIERRWEWARSQFAGGQSVTAETLAIDVSGDLAYTVAIERGDVRLAGRDEPDRGANRATHIYRREDGVWKLLHRHADRLTERRSPTG